MALPRTLVVTLPPDVAIVTLLLPLDIPVDPDPWAIQDRLPAPSVLNIYPDEPPIMVTLALLPKLALFATVMLFVVTSPFANITVVEVAPSPTATPPTKVKGFNDIF